eukprot:12259937-Alexandrium_andersonii.AAC.1
MALGHRAASWSTVSDAQQPSLPPAGRGDGRSATLPVPRRRDIPRHDEYSSFRGCGLATGMGAVAGCPPATP